MTSKALVILSGGQDSTACLFWAKKKFNEVHAITFDYGQRHAREIEAARKVAAMAKTASHEIVVVPTCLISSSPLTSKNDLEQYSDPTTMAETIGDRREVTFVPMRNALFLTIAANRAEALGIPNLVTGVCQMDNANYDDCREIFINATAYYINTALGHDHRGTTPIQIHTPLMFMSKAQTVMMAFEDAQSWAALAYTHTSYAGEYPPTDNNHANVLRAQGFLEAGLPDPLIVRAVSEGLMTFPKTANYANFYPL